MTDIPRHLMTPAQLAPLVYQDILHKNIPEALDRIAKGDKGYWQNTSPYYRLRQLYKELGVLQWVLHQDVPQFRQDMRTSAQYLREFFVQKPEADLGQDGCDELWPALCTGDKEFAIETITFLDQHYDYELTGDPDKALIRNFPKGQTFVLDWVYRCLIALITGKGMDQFPFFLDMLKKTSSLKKWSTVMQYTLIIEAIEAQDSEALHRYVQASAKKYRQSWLCPLFEEAFLSLWGVGLCNLARMRGMPVTFDHKYIPQALI